MSSVTQEATANRPKSTPKRRWPKRAALTVALLGVLSWGAFSIAQYRSDGPLNDMIPGGQLQAGELVNTPITDWSFFDGETVELQLVTPLKSRWVGLVSYNDALYIPCDLGYMWGRFEGSTRNMLHLIYLFKRWHLDAVADGRMVVRFDNKRYPFNATRVADEAELAGLKTHLEVLAAEWVKPNELGPPPTEGPRDIWFFKLEQRIPGVTAQSS